VSVLSLKGSVSGFEGRLVGTRRLLPGPFGFVLGMRSLGTESQVIRFGI